MRIVLLVTSPRLPAGLLTAQAWDVVRGHPVFAGEESAQTGALRASGVTVTVLGTTPAPPPVPVAGAALTPSTAPTVDTLLAAAAETGTAVWLAGPAGDPELARELGLRLARAPGTAELELLYGSWDPPGARLLDAVAVMDRLASPGGDPWKRAQTHQSLARFLLEEAYEAYDAIESGDLAALREELGDLLLQVVLHARLAEELDEEERWSVDDVAGDLVDKMIRRNPHVFAGTSVADVDEITENWEQIKRAEKARESILDGVPLAQPALALAAKVLARVERAGLDVPLPAGGPLGAVLLSAVADARAAGLDAEAELRRAVLTYMDAVRTAE